MWTDLTYQEKQDFWGWLVAIPVVVCVAVFVSSVYIVLMDRPGPYIASWAPPEIPKCEKPTWERIIEGCDQ